ncbi:MAG: sulfite exporter TauE/SafE family protein [Vulcanimicrobiaceae bacterium]
MLVIFAGTSAIGVSIGLVGIGGIFLIPLLVWRGIPLETAIGTSLVTFTVAAIVATIVYAMHGSIDWRAALIASAGSLPSGVFGAKLGTMLPDRVVTACFAVFLLLTGLFALFGRRMFAHTSGTSRRLSAVTLVILGVLTGVGSGLTGAGGSALLIPMLLLAGASPAVAVAISQVNGIFSAASGAAGHVMFGHVDFHLAEYLSIFCSIGVVAGALIYRRVSPERLRTFVGVTVLGLAIWLIGKLLVAGEGL